MGLSASSACLGLGLLLWLLGERVLVSSDLRTGIGAASALLFALALLFDVVALRKLAPEESSGLRLRLVAAALIVSSAAIYVAAAYSGLAGQQPALTWAWLLPLLLGVPARLAADRAYRTGPLDAQRIATRTRAGLRFGCLLGVIVALNYAGVTFDVRKDLSYRAVHEPSAQVRRLVQGFSEPVELLLLFAHGNEVVPVAEPYFGALGHISPKLTVRVQDAALSPDLLRKHKVRGNGYGLLLMGKGEAQRAESFYIGEDLRDARRVLKTLDAHIANHLSVLLRPVRRVYVTMGHGERSVAGDVEEARGRYLRDFERLLARFNVRVQRLGAREGLTRAVPDDAAAVLALGPERPFLAEEAAALEGYVKRGGRVWLGMEPSVDAGLTSLLSLAGVSEAGPSVLCRESFVVRSRTLADQALIQTQRYASHPVTAALRRAASKPQVVFVRATALTTVSEPAMQSQVAVSSERDCFLDTDGDYLRGAHEPQQTLPLLVARAIANERGPEGRIVISADGDLPTDQVLRNEGNTLLTLDIMRWLLGDDALQAVPLLEDDLPVLHQRAEDRAWFYLSAFAVPAPLLAVAIWLWRKRQTQPLR